VAGAGRLAGEKILRLSHRGDAGVDCFVALAEAEANEMPSAFCS
jgi:hypothetical protein